MFMPLHKLLKRPVKHHQRWLFVAKLTLINLLIIAMIVITAGIIGLLMHHSKSINSSPVHSNQHLEETRIVLPVVLLVLVLTVIIIMNLLIRRKSNSQLKPIMSNHTTQITYQTLENNQSVQTPTPKLNLIHDVIPLNYKKSKAINHPRLSVSNERLRQNDFLYQARA